jgi:hypothetical protein
MFAMDVFSEGKGLWETIGDLLLHLVPVFIMLVVLVLAWRWEWIGAVVFVGMALLYVVAMWGNPLSWHLSIAGPAALIGVLFLLNWLFRGQIRMQSGSPGSEAHAPETS